MFCRNCGVQLSDTARFCANCGTPVAAVQSGQPEVTAPEQSTIATPEQPTITMPEQPAITTPEQSTITMPEQSTIATPEQPSITTPEQPAITMPEQPTITMPEQPAITMPEQPAITMPEQPSITTPEQPAFTAPEQPQMPYTATQDGGKALYEYEVEPATPVKKKSKKGLIIGLACGGAALIAGGALAFTFAQSAILRVFMGDEAYARSVASNYIGDAFLDNKQYIDIIANRAGKSLESMNMLSKLTGIRRTSENDEQYKDLMEKYDWASISTAVSLYGMIDMFDASRYDGYTLTTGMSFELGEETKDLLTKNIQDYNKFEPVVDDIVNLINSASCEMSAGKKDGIYDVSLYLNKNGSKFIGGVLRITKEGDVTLYIPEINNSAVKLKLPSYEELGFTGSSEGADPKAVDTMRLYKLYTKLRDAYYSGYKGADIKYTDGSITFGDTEEKCTVITVTYDNLKIANVFYTMADIIDEDDYIPELIANYNLKPESVKNSTDSLRSMGSRLKDPSLSDLKLVSECYVTSRNKPLGIKFTLGMSDNSDNKSTFFVSSTDNDKIMHVTAGMNDFNLFDIVNTRENNETGNIRAVVNANLANTQDNSGTFTINVDYSDVRMVKAFGQEIGTGRYTFSLGDSPAVEKSLASLKTETFDPYSLVRSLKVTIATESATDEGLRSSVDFECTGYGKAGFYNEIKPVSSVPEISSSAEIKEISKDNQDEIISTIGYDTLNYLFGKLEDDGDLSKLNSDIAAISEGKDLRDSLSEAMENIKKGDLYKKHYSAYTSKTPTQAYREAYDIYSATDTSRFANSDLVKIKLWYDPDGSFEIIDNGGEDENVIKDMYSSIPLKSAYAEIFSWKTRTGSYSDSPLGVTVVKTDSKNIEATLPDEYNYIDGVFEWDDYYIKDEYAMGGAPYLGTGTSTSRDKDAGLTAKVKEFNDAAKKISDAFTSYLSSSGNKIISADDEYVVFNVSEDGKFEFSYSSHGSFSSSLDRIFENDIFSEEGDLPAALGKLSLKADEERYATLYFRKNKLIGVLYTDSSWGYYNVSASDFSSGKVKDIEWSYIDGIYFDNVYGTYPVLANKAPAASLSMSNDEGSQLTIYALMSTSNPEMIKTYCSDLIEQAGVEVNIQISESVADYKEAILMSMATCSDLDIFFVEPSYAQRFLDYVMTASELGITDEDMMHQYPYTHELALNSDNEVAGFTWHNTPGLFLYRTDIAEKVLGTSDPEEVQEYLKDWETFEETAAKMKDAGYYMYECPADTYRLFAMEAESELVTNGGKDTDFTLNMWAEIARQHLDSGYCKNTGVFSTEWFDDAGENGKTFGYFFPIWGWNFLTGTDLRWNACVSPLSYYWGGYYMCVPEYSDNKALASEIIKRMTCDDYTMKRLAMDDIDCVNNAEVMQELAYDEDFLTMLSGTFKDPKSAIEMANLAAQDINIHYVQYNFDDIMSLFTEAMTSYITGEKNYADALSDFSEKYASLTAEQ